MFLETDCQEQGTVLYFTIKLLQPETSRMLWILYQFTAGITQVIDIASVTADNVGSKTVGKPFFKLHRPGYGCTQKGVFALSDNAVAVRGHIIWCKITVTGI